MYEQQVARVVEHGQWTALIMNWPSLLLSRVQCSICKKSSGGSFRPEAPRAFEAFYCWRNTYYYCVRAWSCWGSKPTPHQNFRPHSEGVVQWGLNPRTSPANRTLHESLSDGEWPKQFQQMMKPILSWIHLSAGICPVSFPCESVMHLVDC